MTKVTSFTTPKDFTPQPSQEPSRRQNLYLITMWKTLTIYPTQKLYNHIKSLPIVWSRRKKLQKLKKERKARIKTFISLSEKIKNMPKYRLWRAYVIVESKYICTYCKNKTRKMEANHIKPLVNIVTENQIHSVVDAINCAQLWDVKNGEALCVPCYKKTPEYSNSIVE
jgi:hypothetical protein